MKATDIVDMLIRYAQTPESVSLSTEDAKKLARNGPARVTRAQMAAALDAYIDAKIVKELESGQARRTTASDRKKAQL